MYFLKQKRTQRKKQHGPKQTQSLIFHTPKKFLTLKSKIFNRRSLKKIYEQPPKNRRTED
ncbi:hypothetical protein DR087_01675 [Mycoplasma hyopneumoniae]|nr:hypothetical protein [Mesomycoplasma hyopneumoniae]